MQSDIRRVFATALVIGAILLALIGFALHRTVQESRHSATWVAHTHQVIETASDLAAAALLFDASQRGVLVTDADYFRTAREEALQSMRSRASDLERLTADNPDQHGRAQLLVEQVGQRAELALRNEEGVAHGRSSARTAIEDPASLAVIERIHDTLDLVKSGERRLLEQRQQRQDDFQRQTLWIVALAIGGSALVLVWAARGYRREALRRADTESNFQDLVQALPVGVWRLRHDEPRGLRFEFVSDNTPLVRHVDVQSARQEYDNAFRTIHPEDRPQVREAMDRTLRTLEPYEVEYRVPVGDSMCWVRACARARREFDGTVILSGYWADVTRERALRDALAQARDEATQAARAKSAFLAAMSHEIRTPMNGVLGLLELLSLTDLDAEQRSTLAVVRSSGQSLLRIVDDILDFSKMEAERLVLDPAPASLRQLVEGTCQIYASHASGKGLLLHCGVDAAVSPVLVFDRHRLGQILNNLVSNALKFTERGSVILRAESVHRDSGREQVRLTVTDTGIGVSEADLERLFQPFVQSAAGTPARFGGTGLGLAISRRLAELMGGTLTMHSAPGQGTTMTLVCSFPVADPADLPADPAAAAQKKLETMIEGSREAPDAQQAEAEGTLVLVVDDHPTNRMVLKRQLLSLGYVAETANDGRAGFEAWRTGRFALVIADCNMPVMTGHEMARAIRAFEAGHGLRRTPVFACTANAMPSEAGLCQESGMDEYLVKPIGVAELGSHLARWLPLPAGARVHGVDADLLRALTGGDPAAEAELLDEYRRTHDADAQVLRRALADADLPAALQAAHRIRGACATLGSAGLGDAAGYVEEALARGDLAGVQASMDAFEDELARLLDALAARGGGPARRREPSRI